MFTNWRNASSHWRAQLVRFGLVGILNTIVGYGLYAIGILAGLAPTLALFIATCLGALFNYFSIGQLVFKNAPNRSLLRFVLMYASLYVINSFLLKCLIAEGVGELIAQALLVPLMAVLSFVISRKWVFRLS